MSKVLLSDEWGGKLFLWGREDSKNGGDSVIVISLTSKLLWSQGYHQVKLFCGLDSWTSEPGGIVIHFGQGHDYKYGHQTVAAIPENGVGIMDRGFASCERIKELKEKEKVLPNLLCKNYKNFRTELCAIAR